MKHGISRFLMPGLMAIGLLLLLIPAKHTRAWRNFIVGLFRPLLENSAGYNSSSNPQQTPAPLSKPSKAGRQGISPVIAEYMTENQKLRAEMVRLRDENARLRSAFPRGGTPERLPSGITAEVIARRVLWKERLWGVNRGRADGVREDSGVLSGGSVLGRVVAVGDRASSIALLTHRDVLLSAGLVDCRLRGTLRGGAGLKNGRRLCSFSLVAKNPGVQIGEKVVTSGLDGVYPPGLLIGSVVNIKQKGTADWELLVLPAVDPQSVNIVVLLDHALPSVPWPDNPFRRKKKKRKK